MMRSSLSIAKVKRAASSLRRAQRGEIPLCRILLPLPIPLAQETFMQTIKGIIPHGQGARRTPPIQRNWVTPFTFGAFILCAVTGILMFFKIHIGLVKPAHEWLSWLMVVAAAFHLARNRRAFARALARPAAKAVAAVFFLLLGASLLPLGNDQGDAGKRRRQTDQITEALTHAPLATVAKIANRMPEETLQILWGKGVKAQSMEQSIQEIAEENSQRAMDVLAILFQG
jgi:hypothetical protein